MHDANIFCCFCCTCINLIIFTLNIVERITWRSHKLSCKREFSMGVNNTATDDTKKPGAELALIPEGTQVFIYPHHRVLNKIFPMILRNVFCLYLDKPLYKLTAFVPLSRCAVP